MSYRDGDDVDRLDQFSEAERLAFGGLMRLMVGMDKSMTPDEIKGLDVVAVALGKDLFWDSLRQAEEVASKPEEVKVLAQAVKRRGVRELIYSCVAQVAEADTISTPEMALLQALEKMWELTPVVLKDADAPKGDG